MHSLEDRKFLFRMFYANKAFKKAHAACEYLYQSFFSAPDSVFESLATSIHVDYGRPYTTNYGAGKLTEEIVPAQFRHIHDRILELSVVLCN
jgi:hypothetical protein